MTKAPTPTEKSKKHCDNIKTPPKSSITQRLRTDLGRSVFTFFACCGYISRFNLNSSNITRVTCVTLISNCTLFQYWRKSYLYMYCFYIFLYIYIYIYIFFLRFRSLCHRCSSCTWDICNHQIEEEEEESRGTGTEHLLAWHQCYPRDTTMKKYEHKNQTKHPISSNSHPSAPANKAIHNLKIGGGGDKTQ